VVELTVAMLKVFNPPEDRIIWDVGHQCYAYKILTGRNDRFETLRSGGGLAGFPRREESPFDAFDTGHAGTSISAALGMARARDHQGLDRKVVAVIGDGSMTAGLAFEGLNHAGALDNNLTVILNDNKMSISQNIGALSQHLNRIITGRWYTRLRKEGYSIFQTIMRGQITDFARRVEAGVKGVFIPGKLFEDLGFRYIGPIDGHEMAYLVETLEAVKELKGPKLLHVVTTKGKGYKPAESRSHKFHGVSPFHTETGNAVATGTKPTYTRVFSDALIALAGVDEKIVGITAAMPEGTGLDRFAEKYPERFYDVGIAEQHATTFAAGLAADGMKPVVAIYSTFFQRLFDQVVHDVCLMNHNVTFAIDRAGLVGEDGATHQGVFDLTIMRCVPNMILMAPKDENELRRMLKTALDHPGPAAFRYPRGAAVGVELDATIEPVPIGEGELLRQGEDLLIIAIGDRVNPALEAAALLEKEGFSASVMNARFIKPLDEKMISEQGERCGLILTVEEGALSGGFGSAVLELIESGALPHAAVRRLGIGDQFVQQESQANQRKTLKLDPEGIFESALAFLREHKEPSAKSSLSGASVER